MKWQTHALLGINALWLLQLLPNIVNPNNIAPLAACAAFSALLPDLDAADSKIKHLQVAGIEPFALPATALHRALGHRGLLHSLLGLSVIAVVALFQLLWWNWQIWVALVLGYISHLAVDACTKSGIPLLYPNPQRFYLLPLSCRFITGSLVEEMLLLLLAVILIPLFWGIFLSNS